MKAAARTLPAVALIGTSALAQISSDTWIDLAAIDREEIAAENAPLETPIEAWPQVLLSEELAPAPPDASLDLPLAQLGLDASAFLAVPVVPASALTRTPSTRLNFSLAQHNLNMVIVESRLDRDFEAQHLTLAATHTDDYARLTISRSGPEIVGTLFVGGTEYRVLPDQEEFQLVYPVAAHAGAWRRESLPDLETRAGQLEARHLQAGWVAENRPDSFGTQSDGRLEEYLGEASLGRLNFWDALEFDAAGDGTVDEEILRLETERFLNSIAHFTWIDEYLEVQLNPVELGELPALTSQGIRFEMTQLINGVPITQSLALGMDATGEVTLFRGTLMRREMANAGLQQRIQVEDARASVVQEIANEHGIEIRSDFDEETLSYRVVSPMELNLIWQMQLKAECGITFVADVDGITGRVTNLNYVAARREDSRRSFFYDPLFECRARSGR